MSNLIDYNQAIEAIEKERQYLLNREQYEAENVLVHHALNVISELPIIRQPKLVRCKDCNISKLEKVFKNVPTSTETVRWCELINRYVDDYWFCADGEVKDDG